MQIYQTDIFQSGAVKTGLEKNRTRQGGFEREFEAAQAKLYKTPAAAVKEDMISLGKVSSDQPTVSHLMVNHPACAHECWDIVHSEQNHDKPYARIPEGTEIFLNPETGELSWKGGEGARDTSDTKEKPGHFSFDSKMETIKESIDRAASEHSISSKLIACVIRAESGFDPFAVSMAGAQGLMQLMPETARELGVSDPFDIRENIDAGARYLKKMLHDFGGGLEKALAAYNAGPAAVKRFAGDVPYAETREYVDRVLSFLSPQ